MRAMFDAFSKGTADIEGVEIAYVIGGTGPPVLLLHGFPQCKALWAKVAPLLAARFTVVCADLRGYGDSGKPRCAPDHSNYAFRAMAGDQLGLMKKLGFERFHVVGHDRGGRTGHRLALDHSDCLLTLTVMDIAPTYSMFMQTNWHIAQAYWHWYFLAQPEPFPETLIAADPDFFYERSLLGWGAARLEDFDAGMLAEYRRAWRDPKMIHGSCSDYRAAGSVDLVHDTEDLKRRVECPALMFYGSKGVMARQFDLPAQWRTRLADMTVASLPGGHFFVDQFPAETAEILLEFLGLHLDGKSVRA
jgi:haloacetate dehalogenase